MSGLRLPPVLSAFRASPRAALVAFSLLLLAGLWGMTVHWIGNEEREARAGVARDAENIARSLEEHTIRTIQAADQAVIFLAYEYGKLGPKLDIPGYLDTGVILGDIFVLFSLVDERGDVIGSSKPFTPMNLSDREHIRVHFPADTKKLFIGKPVLGRVSGKWSIQMTRRINKPDGSFGGVVVVSLDPFYFSRFYSEMRLGRHASVALVGADGVIRARHPATEGSVGKDIRDQPNVAEMLRRGGAGRFGTKSDIDGVERLYAYRQLADYPLFVVVGLAEEEAMRAYQDSRSQAIAMGVFGTAGILAATVVLLLLISRVERSRALAEQASRSKSEFLANMSHELRTPLNGILGYSELLKEDLRDQPQAEFAEAIHDSGAHLLAIVNDVLDMSKVESGHVEVEKSPDSPVRLLQQAVGGHQASASRKGLALAAAVGPRVPESAMLDRTKVLRILNNLLHNAVKFTEKGGVDASVEVRGLEIVFSVRDTGPGIPVDLQEAIFGKFMQGDSSLSKRHEGTGLGLALCSDLARIMGGRVWLMSRPGEGSTFFLAVPLEPVEAAHKEHALA